MASYKEEIAKLSKQRSVFVLIRNICIPVFIVLFIVAVAFLSSDMIQNGEYTYGTLWVLGQVFAVLAEFAFDGIIAGAILGSVWNKKITNRMERIQHGYNSEDEWNGKVPHEVFVEETKEKETPTKDFTNPDDPFH